MGDPQAPRTGGLLELTRPVTTLPPARTIARLLTSEWDCRSAEPLRVGAVRALLDRSMTMMAAKTTDDLTPRLTVALGDITPKQAAEAKEVAFVKRMAVSRALAAVLYRAHAAPARKGRGKVAEPA